MAQFDEKVLDVFLEKQEKLFPEPVAETREEAEEFLSDAQPLAHFQFQRIGYF